jgi:hypothetical protein
MPLKQINKIGFSLDNHKLTPIILCDSRIDFPQGMEFYCKYCKIKHKHGIGDGHRVAHCEANNSPYFNAGYVTILNRGNLKDTKEALIFHLNCVLKDLKENKLYDLVKTQEDLIKVNVKNLENLF